MKRCTWWIFASLIMLTLAACSDSPEPQDPFIVVDDEPDAGDPDASDSGDIVTCVGSDLDCGPQGRCVVANDQLICQCGERYAGENCELCAEGFQDNNGDGICEANCQQSGLFCNNNGSCSSASGAARCDCREGYGGASCSVCATGYQDKDDDGSCRPSCDTAELECGMTSSCSDASGTAECVCAEGYTGDDCTECADGFQDNDANGTCLPTCETSGVDCGAFGACSDTDGEAMCVCDASAAGDDCTECAEGFQDNDQDGICEPTCTTAALDCGAGSCDASSGTPLCACDEGYQGASCDECAFGYQDNDANFTCEPGCSTAALDCGDFGACNDFEGQAICECEAAYDGPSCDQCAEGFQDNDGDGICEPTCADGELICIPGQTCDDSSGTPTCECATGYTGPNCTDCALGYQDNDEDGVCSESCDIAILICDPTQTCDDASGTATCVCPEGTVFDENGRGCVEEV